MGRHSPHVRDPFSRHGTLASGVQLEGFDEPHPPTEREPLFAAFPRTEARAGARFLVMPVYPYRGAYTLTACYLRIIAIFPEISFFAGQINTLPLKSPVPHMISTQVRRESSGRGTMSKKLVSEQSLTRL